MLIKKEEGEYNTRMVICILHSVTSELNCVTSSTSTRMTSTGCPAEQPMTASSVDEKFSRETDSNNIPEFTGSQSL